MRRQSVITRNVMVSILHGFKLIIFQGGLWHKHRLRKGYIGVECPVFVSSVMCRLKNRKKTCRKCRIALLCSQTTILLVTIQKPFGFDDSYVERQRVLLTLCQKKMEAQTPHDRLSWFWWFSLMLKSRNCAVMSTEILMIEGWVKNLVNKHRCFHKKHHRHRGCLRKDWFQLCGYVCIHWFRVLKDLTLEQNLTLGLNVSQRWRCFQSRFDPHDG